MCEWYNPKSNAMAASFSKPFQFRGEGSSFFGISLINGLLTIITLGLYRPWAITSIRKFLWENTGAYGSGFKYHGKGIEIFRGYVIIFVVLFVTMLTNFISPALFAFLFAVLWLAVILYLLPYAVFSAYRYRVSRTSWRGIYFSFDGNFQEYYSQIIKNMGMLGGGYLVVLIAARFTHPILLIVAGILFLGLAFYAFSWFGYFTRKYLIDHTSIGTHKLKFNGELPDLILINIFFVFSFILIFIPMALQKRMEYIIGNTSIVDPDGKESRLAFTLTIGEAYQKYFLNFLLTAFTFGLGAAWAYVNILKMNLTSIAIENSFNPDSLEQDYSRKLNNDGLGEALGGQLDTDFGMDFGL